MAAATQWYSDAFGTTPYFNEPFYVGFSIGGYELGLQPVTEVTTTKGQPVITYWGVENIHAEYQRLMALGAKELEAPNNVGGPIEVASLIDPWGNAIGLIYNPTFEIQNP